MDLRTTDLEEEVVRLGLEDVDLEVEVMAPATALSVSAAPLENSEGEVAG